MVREYSTFYIQLLLDPSLFLVPGLIVMGQSIIYLWYQGSSFSPDPCALPVRRLTLGVALCSLAFARMVFSVEGVLVAFKTGDHW